MIPWLDCLSIKNYLQLEKDSDRIEIADLRKNKTRLVSRRNVLFFPTILRRFGVTTSKALSFFVLTKFYHEHPI